MNRGVGRVMAVEYPFSTQTYDAVYDLFEVGKFKLINPRKPQAQHTPLELTVAPTIETLQKLVGLGLAIKPREESEEEESETAMDLTPRITEGAHSHHTLIPAALWEAHAAAAASAARTAREWKAVRHGGGGASDSNAWVGHVESGIRVESTMGARPRQLERRAKRFEYRLDTGIPYKVVARSRPKRSLVVSQFCTSVVTTLCIASLMRASGIVQRRQRRASAGTWSK